MAHTSVSTTAVYCLQSKLPTPQSVNVTAHCSQNEKTVTIQLCQYQYPSSNIDRLVHNELEWTWKEVVTACLKYQCTFAWRDRAKPMKICQASWCHGQDSHQALSSEPIPSVGLYNLSITVTRTSALFMSQSTSVCPCPSSYHNSPPVHIVHASKCHYTHSSICLHSPSSNTVHLCRCNCSVKSQMIGLILQWRLNVTTLLMAVLSILKCLQDWAVFIIPSSYNLHIRPLSNTIPKECYFQGQL